jgi:hypothetical protein
MNVIQHAVRRVSRVTAMSVLAIGGLVGTEGPGAPTYTQVHGKVCTYLPRERREPATESERRQRL